MTFYELLLFLHISASIIWLGAGFVLLLLILGAERAGDRAKEGMIHRDVGWLVPRLFIPASLATLVLGILLVADSEAWSFDQLWIVVALAGWATTFALGFFYFRPEAERIGELVAEHGPAHPEVDRRVHRLNVVDRAQVVLLFLVVADMVLKPTGDDGALLVVGALVLATVVAAASVAIRRGPPAREGAEPAAAPGAA